VRFGSIRDPLAEPIQKRRLNKVDDDRIVGKQGIWENGKMGFRVLIRSKLEYQNLTDRLIGLYAESIEKCVRNEKSRQQS